MLVGHTEFKVIYVWVRRQQDAVLIGSNFTQNIGSEIAVCGKVQLPLIFS